MGIITRDEQMYRDLLESSEVPPTLHNGLVLYLTQGIRPGSFLTAVLSNQLVQAVNAGDESSLAALVPLVRWLYMAAPALSWSSESNMQAWIQMNRRQRGSTAAVTVGTETFLAEGPTS